MKITDSAGGVVLNEKGEVLVVRQPGGSWSLPKGHLDSGESALGAAQREIMEESGVRDLTLLKDLGSYERYRIGLKKNEEDQTELKHIHLFLFTTKDFRLKPIDPLHTQARWVSKENVAEVLTHPKDKLFFKTSVLPYLP